MITTDQKARKASRKHVWTENLGIGLGQRPRRSTAKNLSLCHEEGCEKPIAYWLKFWSGRMGFYCKAHKERFELWGIVARIESAQREGE